MKPIASADQMTPDWLTQVLWRSGYLKQGHVVSAATSGSSSNATEGPGFHKNNRIEIHYSSDATPSAPTRLYLKAQDRALHKSAGAREVAFYLSAATQMPAPPAPICFDAAYGAESAAYHLLLEDVCARRRTIPPEEPATRNDVERMLDALAKLHAHWWGHAQLGQSVGMLPTTEAIRASFDQLGMAFPKYV